MSSNIVFEMFNMRGSFEKKMMTLTTKRIVIVNMEAFMHSGCVRLGWCVWLGSAWFRCALLDYTCFPDNDTFPKIDPAMRVFSVGGSRQSALRRMSCVPWSEGSTSITIQGPLSGCIKHATLDCVTRIARVAYCASTR